MDYNPIALIASVHGNRLDPPPGSGCQIKLSEGQRTYFAFYVGDHSSSFYAYLYRVQEGRYFSYSACKDLYIFCEMLGNCIHWALEINFAPRT